MVTFTYIYHQYTPNVIIYSIRLDSMGYNETIKKILDILGMWISFAASQLAKVEDTKRLNTTNHYVNIPGKE